MANPPKPRIINPKIQANPTINSEERYNLCLYNINPIYASNVQIAHKTVKIFSVS